MHIMITGTRGIPAQYGGFETFAQELSRRLAGAGHRVTVFVPASHPYRQRQWEGVALLRKSWPSFPGGVLWYDRLCMEEAYRQRPDMILNCGYGNALFIRKDHPVPVVTLTDGLEWMRAGWSLPARLWLRRMESVAVRRSRRLVSDHPVIAQHFRDRYGTDTPVIPYGAEIPSNPVLPATRNLPQPLREKISPGNFFLTVGRFVPENNLEMILEGHRRSEVPYPLVMVGDHNNRYGKRLRQEYGRDGKVLFAGSIYDKPLLDGLRHEARGYLHGHSAGGTNPALLEAMAAGSLIAALDNPFSRYVLGENAAFFSSVKTLSDLLRQWDELSGKRSIITEGNLRRIHTEYSWKRITEIYLRIFRDITS
jgi:glycosyltransferase involved in cell wall biosynthesis